jgi:hypothetical protein
MNGTSEVMICLESNLVVHGGKYVGKCLGIVHHFCQLPKSTYFVTYFQIVCVIGICHL